MTQYERFQERIVQYEVNRRNGRMPLDNGSARKVREEKPVKPVRTEKPKDELKPFDVSKWRLTPEAYKKLVWTGAIPGPQRQKTPPEIAAENEAKYGGQLTATDRIMERFGNNVSTQKIYAEIEGMAGRNGYCNSRKTTYRRFKYGNGSLSQRSFERQGFDQNLKAAEV